MVVAEDRRGVRRAWGEVTMIHVAACCICGSAPARLGDAGPGLRAAPVLRAAPAQRAGVGIWPECHRERARVGTWVRAVLTSAETVV